MNSRIALLQNHNSSSSPKSILEYCRDTSKMTVQIPSVQTAALIKNPGPNARIEIRHDYPVPQPGKNEVLLKMECSGIW